MEMSIGKACVIFLQIESEQYTEEEKAVAIYKVLEMPTHNGITKDSILSVVRYLLNMLYDVELGD